MTDSEKQKLFQEYLEIQKKHSDRIKERMFSWMVHNAPKVAVGEVDKIVQEITNIAEHGMNSSYNLLPGYEFKKALESQSGKK